MHTYLKELLNSNNRVIIPDFGAFIIKHGSKKLVIFNEFLKYNDGLLIDSIASKENISKEEATKKVSGFVSEMSKKLKDEKKYELGDFGTLEMNNLNKIIFHQQGSVKEAPKKDEKPASATKKEPEKPSASEAAPKQPAKEKEAEKPSVSSTSSRKPEEKQSEQKPQPPKEDPKPDPRKETPKTTTATGKTAASTATNVISSTKTSYTPPAKGKTTSRKKQRFITASVIILANVLLIVGILIARNHFGFGDSGTEEDKVVLSPQQSGEERTDKPEEASVNKEAAGRPVDEDEAVIQEEAGKIAKDIANDLQTNNANTKEAVRSNTGTSVSNKYYVVAGCFAVERNADRFVTTLRGKGYAAEKFGMINNLHAVCYESFPTRGEAQRALNQIRNNESPNAWVYASN